MLGPANVPGLSQYGYRIDVPGASVVTNITWSVDKPSATIVGAANQKDVTIRFSNAGADWVRVRADFTIDGHAGCAQKQVAVVHVQVDAPTFTTPGVPTSSNAGTKSFLVTPPAPPAVETWVTVHDPGSACAAFTYNGTLQTAEGRQLIRSSGAGDAFHAQTKVKLTSPPEQPTAHQRIQIGYIQHGSDAGGATYAPAGRRTVTVPTASTVDWLSSPCTPGGTDDWPWYDQTARATGAGASPWTTTLSMGDAPALSIPAQCDPNHPANPNSGNALNTANETFSFDIRIAVRTLDNDLDADKHYFDESHSTWNVHFVWPMVPAVSIVATGAGWTVPPNASEVSVNVVPTVTNHNGPFLRWIPS